MSESLVCHLVILLARNEARQLRHANVEPEHLLIGICRLERDNINIWLYQNEQKRSIIDQAQAEIAALLNVFARRQLDLASFRHALRDQTSVLYPQVAIAPPTPSRSHRSRTLFEQAKIPATRDHSTISVLHLLSVIMAIPTATIEKCLSSTGVQASILRDDSLATTAVHYSGTVIHRASANAPPFESDQVVQADEAVQLGKRLQLFYAISQAIIAADDSQLFATIARQIQTAIPDAQRGAIMIAEAGQPPEHRAQWPDSTVSLSQSWASRALREREAFIWSARSSEAGVTPESVLKARLKAAIYAPLVYADKPLGVLHVDNHERVDAFTSDDLDMMRAVAAQAAVVIHQQAMRREQERLVLARANLQRHFARPLIDQIMNRYNQPGEAPTWSAKGTVLAVRLRPPAESSATERLRLRNDLSDALADELLKLGSALSRGSYDETFIAVFGSLDEEDSTPCAVKAGWALTQRSFPGGWSLSIGMEFGTLAQKLSSTLLLQNADEYTPNERGLERARRLLNLHTLYAEFLIHEDALKLVISQLRKHGRSENFKAERSIQVDRLNSLLLAATGQDFNYICFNELTAPNPIEYQVAGDPVDQALNLAMVALPGTLLLGHNAYGQSIGLGEMTPHPSGLPAYVMRSLHKP